MAAADLLQGEFGVAADVYSVTSFTELRRGVSERGTKNSTTAPQPVWIEHQLPMNGTPVIAASDYVAAVPDLIRPWIADRYVTLGTDGFGRSDTRAALREYFRVDRHSIASAALTTIADPRADEAAERWRLAHASLSSQN